MARLNTNPVKPVLTGTEGWGATDSSTNLDVGLNPFTITQFVATNMQLANGSSNGLVTAAERVKLDALPTNSQLAVQWGQISEFPIPIFVGSPSNGHVDFYIHAPDVILDLSSIWTQCSAGSTNIVVTQNGSPIPSWPTFSATTAKSGPNSQANVPEVNQGDVLGLTFSGTTGNCANLMVTLFGKLYYLLA